jgi:hypothetical protein
VIPAANTYTGGTTITGGTLVATNAAGSATGTGVVAANANGTLAGTGTIAGPLTVNTGGAVRPGDPTAPGVKTGVLTVGSANLAAATSTLGIKLNGTIVGGQYDQLQITSGGTAVVGSNIGTPYGATLSVNLGAVFTGTGSEKFVIISNQTGGPGGTANPFSLLGGNYFASLAVEPSPFAGGPGGTFAFAAPIDNGDGTYTSSATDSGSGFTYTLTYNLDSANPTQVGNDAVLSVVPEPGTLGLAGAAMAGLLLRRRRRPAR